MKTLIVIVFTLIAFVPLAEAQTGPKAKNKKPSDYHRVDFSAVTLEAKTTKTRTNKNKVVVLDARANETKAVVFGNPNRLKGPAYKNRRN